MTKDEYIAWKASRGEAGTWDLSMCRAADNLIKTVVMANLEAAILHIPYRTREYVQLMVSCHYGSVETDEYLTGLKCYPDWL